MQQVTRPAGSARGCASHQSVLPQCALWITISAQSKRTCNAVNGTTFDAFSAARALESAGVERAQAEAIASALAAQTVTRADLDPLATKADLATIRWAIGLIAAITFAIALRVFGVI